MRFARTIADFEEPDTVKLSRPHYKEEEDPMMFPDEAYVPRSCFNRVPSYTTPAATLAASVGLLVSVLVLPALVDARSILWHPVEGVATTTDEEVTGRLAGGCAAGGGTGPNIAPIANGEIIVVYARHFPADPTYRGGLVAAVRTTTGQWQTVDNIPDPQDSIQDTPVVAFSLPNNIHLVYRSDEDGCEDCDELFLPGPEPGDPNLVLIQEIFYRKGTRAGATINWDAAQRVSKGDDLVNDYGRLGRPLNQEGNCLAPSR
jgi:hypothetical protein